MLLVISMVLSTGITGAKATSSPTQDAGTNVNTEDAITLEPSKDLELIQDTIDAMKHQLTNNISDENVIFIVELEGRSLLETKPNNLSVNQYLGSTEGSNAQRKLEQAQHTIVSRILQERNGMTIRSTYQVVLNGFAVSGPASELAYLESLPGVVSVSVAQTYTYVEPVDGYEDIRRTSRFNKAAGITLGWNKIEGAIGYSIYRKTYHGTDEWVRIATIEGNETFTWQDTSVKNNNGSAYKYTIRALAGADMKTLSGCRNAGRSMVRLTSRTLNSAVKTSATSIKCTWTTSAVVTGYEVRFMVGSTVYKTFTVGNYKTGVKTFTGLESGQTYKIQVRSHVKIDGMGFYSAWSEPQNVKLP